MKYAIGVDLGGTNIAVGIVDGERRKIVHKESIKTRAPRPCKEIAQDICDLSRTVCEHYGITLSEVAWVGVGTPGIVKDGVVLTASNLGWNNDPLGEYIKEGLKVPCYVGNDANVAAFAEAIWGSGHGDPSLVAITLGTGVGGGIVINGKIWDGFNGFAAELGHVIVDAEGRECGCGKRGCLEAYCSATALIRESKRMMGLYKDSVMWQIVGGDLGKVDGKTAFDAAAQGDFAAKVVVDSFIHYLAVGVSNMINIFQPHVVCIGGGVSRQGDALLLPLRRQVESMSFGYHQGRTRVEIAAYQNDAGIIGAALLGIQEKTNTF